MADYGLIGETLKHSFSPMIHKEFNNRSYGLFEVSKEDIDDYLKRASFKAVNVTIPYKETAMRYCIPDEIALKIGSVNTLVKTPEGIKGYNTDILGFEYMLASAGISLKGEDVVILGSGGTSKTACYAASFLGAHSITVVSRNGNTYQTRVDCTVNFTDYEHLSDFATAGILINTTPVGMYPNNFEEPVDIDIFTQLKGVADVIYNPLHTSLVLKAKEKGIKAVNGLAMLVAQAYYAEKLFFGESFPDVYEDTEGALIIKKVQKKLEIQKTNYVLLGMPGCGKSTLARLLAEHMGYRLTDTDDEFSKTFGISPGEYIETYGEEAFREKESLVVRQVAVQGGQIIATGGGTVTKKGNCDVLKQNGYMIYLSRNLESLAIEGRPLSQGTERLRALYYERLPLYIKACDVLCEVDDDRDVSMERLLKVIESNYQRKHKFLVLNGSNLNMLGIREPDIYGSKSYMDLIRLCDKEAEKLNVEVEFLQSNHEGDLVDAIQNAYGRTDGIVINPGAFTHTSVALLDALKAVGIPTVEVHISEVDKREDFRQISYVRKAVLKTISGKGFEGYTEALRFLVGVCNEK